MKHLKKYNEIVDDEVFSDVCDIFQELEDEGFIIIVHKSSGHIYISKLHGFKYEDVKETLLRLKDYLSPNTMEISASPFSISGYEIRSCKIDENGIRGHHFTHDKDITDMLFRNIIIDYQKFTIYNESVEEKSMDDIRDICQELKDDGFSVDFAKGNITISFLKKNTRVGVWNSDFENFKYTDVIETVLRLRDYLGDNYIKTLYSLEHYKLININIEKVQDLPYKIKYIYIIFRTDGIIESEDMI